MSAATEASEIAARWVARIGGGFHPDTRGSDYVDETGAPYLTPAEADAYDADIDRLFEIAADPYAEGLAAMNAAGWT